MFTSNHDENSWAGTEFERMGDAVKAMAVLTFTLPNGQPLIYTGQEMGWNKRFEFFEKDHIPAWEQNEYTTFYKELIALRHDNPVLSAGERGGAIQYIESVPETVFAFERKCEECNNRVAVYVNFSAEPTSVVIDGVEHTLTGWDYKIIATK